MPTCRLSGLLLALALAGCTSTSGGPVAAGPGPLRGGPHIITAEELQELQASNAFDALQRLRPEWLREGSAIGGRPGVVVVYLDGSRFGDPHSLRQIPLEHIVSMRYLSTRQVMAELPSGQQAGVSGAIMVSTSRLGGAVIEPKRWTVGGSHPLTTSLRILTTDTRASTAEGLRIALEEGGWTDPLFTGEQLPEPATDGRGIAFAAHFRYPRYGVELMHATSYRSSASGYKQFSGVLHGEGSASNSAALVTVGQALRVGAGPGLATTRGAWERRHHTSRDRWVERRVGLVADLSLSLPGHLPIFAELRAHGRLFPDLKIPAGEHFPGARVRDRSLLLGIGGGFRF